MKINEVIGLDIDKNMEFGKNVHALFNEIISNSSKLAQIKLLNKYLTEPLDWAAEISELDNNIQSFNYFITQKLQNLGETNHLLKLKNQMILEVIRARNEIDITKSLSGIYRLNNK
jgi:hypothetical protein